MSTKRLLIKGIVQGVYYRATAKETAEKLGLTGWIRNTPEGDVEAMISGEDKQLSAFIDWCRQGPPGARVSSVDVADAPDQRFPDFRIRRD